MRFSTDLVLNLARALDRAEPDAGDPIFFVPSMMLPTMRLIAAQGRMAAFDSALAQRQSFTHTASLSRGASLAGTTGRIATLGKGFWRVVLHLSHLANFTQASDGSAVGLQVLFDDNAGQTRRLLSSYSVNAVPQHQLGTFEWVLVEDGFFLNLEIGPTGVGQTHEGACSIVGSRLL